MLSKNDIVNSKTVLCTVYCVLKEKYTNNT